jgi:hypothetical protein
LTLFEPVQEDMLGTVSRVNVRSVAAFHGPPTAGLVYDFCLWIVVIVGGEQVIFGHVLLTSSALTF